MGAGHNNVSLERSDRDVVCHRFEVEGIMNVHAETVGVQGLLLGPVHEFHEQ